MDEFVDAWVGDGYLVYVYGWDGEPRAREERSAIPAIGHRAHPRRNTTLALLLSELEAGTKLEEGVSAEEGANEDSVGTEGALDLNEGARQVVGPV